MTQKPLGRKSYGSIGHLPNSRMGPADRKITDGQERIATLKKRDKHDVIIVQEKLDGSNVGVALKDGNILALGRAGYLASSSPYSMHHKFSEWVVKNEDRFRATLKEGERLCGEWLIKAHGTIYDLPHEPFVVFDIIDSDNVRLNYQDFKKSVDGLFVLPALISIGDPVTVEFALDFLGYYGLHGAKEKIEGAVWRVERKGAVDYLCKYVRPDKVDGKYLGNEDLMNKWIGGI